MMTQMRRFFLLLVSIIFTSSLAAIDYNMLTSYRVGGTKSLERILDKELTYKEYWIDQLREQDTTFGYIESYNNVLLCNKDESKLYVYRRPGFKSKFNLVKQYEAFTGAKRGDKYKEGDLKTPVGVYELVEKKDDVDPFYGPLAYVTSYPNLFDNYKRKTGKGIWIHGLPYNQERDAFTKGCIAIDNENMECLNKNINITKTILVINETDLHAGISKDKLAIILADLYKWRYAWLYNDIETYLGFYDESFERYDGMNKQEFRLYKERVFDKNEQKTIVFSNINILPYPNTENLYMVTFHEKYRSRSFRFSGEKSLIVKLLDNQLSIITEK